MRHTIYFLLFFFGNALPMQTQTLRLHANLESIGIEVDLPMGYDTDQTSAAEFRYRVPGQAWVKGFPLSRIEWNNRPQFRGSIFMATAGTTYELAVTLTDSIPVFTQMILSGQITTRRDPKIAATANVRYVSPLGSDTLYTSDKPGNLQALLATSIVCGTTIILRGGEYAIGGLQINLTEDCTADSPIIFKAAPGENPVFNGGDSTQYVWMPHEFDPNMYFTAVAPGLENGALCILDGQRLFPYASVSPIIAGYPSLTDLKYGHAGYYRNGLSYFIKTPEGKNPNGHTVVLSRYANCMVFNGNKKHNFLYFKGLTFKYYGKGSCDYYFGNINQPSGCYTASTLQFSDASEVTVDSCIFWFNNNSIVFQGIANQNTIQNCRMYDQTGLWSHAAFKQSRDALLPVQIFGIQGDFGSFGRYLETSAILFQPATDTSQGNILRNNHIDGYVVGIAVGSGAEHDISNNDIGNCFDAIESTGGFVNHRIWGNRLHHSPVGMSMAVPAYGPFYVFRNVFDHLGSRFNYLNPNQTDGGDPHFVDCNNVGFPVSWGTALKLNAGTSTPYPGAIFFIHNTVHGIDSLGFNLYLWNNTWKKLWSRNNIYYTSAGSNFFFDGIQGLTSYSFDSESDNFYTVNQHSVARIRPLHGVQLCTTDTSLVHFEMLLQNITASTEVKVKNGNTLDPKFEDVSSGNFYLQPGSPMIDAAVSVPGFNDVFFGAAPDLGAFESTTVRTIELSDGSELSILIFPNPSAGGFEVRAQTPLISVAVFDNLGRCIATQRIKNEQSVQMVLDPGLFWIRIQSQDGRIITRLVQVF